MLDASNVDAVALEKIFVLGPEIFAHHRHQADFSKIAGSYSEVGECSGQHTFYAAGWA